MVLRSRVNTDFSINLSAFVLGKLTSVLPKREYAATTWRHLQNLQLADVDFCHLARIDCILGADVYPAIILPGLRKGPPPQPVAQNTTLGWIVTGYASTRPDSKPAPCHSHYTAAVSLDDALSRFWEIEEVAAAKPSFSQEEKECEELFSRTHARDEEGRYVLRLPFSQVPNWVTGYSDLSTVADGETTTKQPGTSHLLRHVHEGNSPAPPHRASDRRREDSCRRILYAASCSVEA